MRFDTLITFTIGLTTKTGGILLPTDVITSVVAPELKRYGIDCFSVGIKRGYWQGKAENSLCIEIYIDSDEYVEVFEDLSPKGHPCEQLAQRFAAACEQECVLWSILDCSAGLGYSTQEA